MGADVTRAKAVLVRRATVDGLVEVEEHVQLGREYIIDLDTVRVARLVHRPTGGQHDKAIVDAEQPDGSWGWVALDLLNVYETIDRVH